MSTLAGTSKPTLSKSHKSYGQMVVSIVGNELIIYHIISCADRLFSCETYKRIRYTTEALFSHGILVISICNNCFIPRYPFRYRQIWIHFAGGKQFNTMKVLVNLYTFVQDKSSIHILRYAHTYTRECAVLPIHVFFYNCRILPVC